MQRFFLLLAKCMLWGSIPLAFGFEYWEHFLSISDAFHMLFQVLLLGITVKWIFFWEQKLSEFEMEISFKSTDDADHNHRNQM